MCLKTIDISKCNNIARIARFGRIPQLPPSKGQAHFICSGYDPPRNSNHSRALNAILIPLSALSLSSPRFSCSFPSSSRPPFTTFCEDMIKCAPITRENLLIFNFEFDDPILYKVFVAPIGFLYRLGSVVNKDMTPG